MAHCPLPSLALSLNEPKELCLFAVGEVALFVCGYDSRLRRSCEYAVIPSTDQ